MQPSARASDRGALASTNHLWLHEVTLAPAPESVPAARRFVQGHLEAHDLPVLVDDVTLVVSELATNAVAHAGTPFSVSLTAVVGTVFLEVRDGAGARPVLVGSHVLDEAGRGVAIVDVVSREWGVVAHSNTGKSVWAAFSSG